MSSPTLSLPILGCMSLGSKSSMPWALEDEAALALMKAAYDRGITTWDTSNTYSSGQSEELIGKAIRMEGIEREKMCIMTKCFAPVSVGGDGEEDGEKPGYGERLHLTKRQLQTGSLSRSAIHASVESSLVRLQTTYIDVLQIARFDPNTPLEETMSAIHDLVVSEKVRHVGACGLRLWQFAILQETAERNGWTRFSTIQIPCSLLYREEERDLIQYCDATNVSVIAYGVLGGGSLTRPPVDSSRSKLSPSERKIVERVADLAGRKKWNMSHVALSWITSKTTSWIIDFDRVDRVDEALVGIEEEKKLSDEERRYLEEEYVAKEVQVLQLP